MVDVNAINYEEAYVDNGKIGSNMNRGTHRVLYDTYVAAADAIATDILIGRTWTSNQIHSFRVITAALGASSTLQLFLRTREQTPQEVAISEAFDTSSAGAHIPVAADIANLPTSVLNHSGEKDILLRVAGGAITGQIKAWIDLVND